MAPTLTRGFYALQHHVQRMFLPTMPKIYSHPRSGTHLMRAFLAENFYPSAQLALHDPGRVWGHWADRQVFDEPVPNGLIPASHYFPSQNPRDRIRPTIYIYRDGRAVALSLWKSIHFMNPTWQGISFADFLRRPIDWEASPGFRVEPHETLAAHWARHVLAWHEAPYKSCCFIRYEQLVGDPAQVLEALCNSFGFLQRPEHTTAIRAKVGIVPNKSQVDSWKDAFTDEDERFFRKEIGPEAESYLWV
ncbi:MAG: sulfotransferase [Planctomycetales bacterium]|nr:sulfotransferase [Planctomycetales bacterium]